MGGRLWQPHPSTLAYSSNGASVPPVHNPRHPNRIWIEGANSPRHSTLVEASVRLIISQYLRPAVSEGYTDPGFIEQATSALDEWVQAPSYLARHYFDGSMKGNRNCPLGVPVNIISISSEPDGYNPLSFASLLPRMN
jgi:hypothetical protein